MPTLSELEVRYRSDVAQKAAADATALNAMAQGMDAVEKATERTDQRLSRSSQSFDRIRASLDGNEAATRRVTAAQAAYERRVETVNAALQRGEITQREAQALLGRLAVQLDQATARAAAYGQAIEQRFVPAQQQAAQATHGAAQASDRASHALRGLGIQSIDVFQQLASGAPVMTTFIQQGSQVAQQSAAMGVSLGTLARGAASVVLSFAPAIVAFGALATAAGGAWAVLSRASELAAQQRALSVAIQGVGRSAELSSGQMQAYVRQLERQGVASGDALSSVSGLARNGSLSAGTIGRIVSLGPDAAAALGTGVPEAMERLARAARGGMDAIQDLSDAFNLLSPAEEANIRRMIEHGDRATALGVVFDKLQGQVQGLSRDALSPAEQAVRDMSNAWNGFLDRVANSGLVLGAIERLAAGLRAIASLIGPGGSSGGDVGSIDAQIAAMSGVIPGTNATAARMRREQAEALARLNAQRNALAQGAADAAEFGAGIPPSVVIEGLSTSSALGMPSAAAGREVDRAAADRAASSPAGQLRRLMAERDRYQTALNGIVRGSDEWAARAPTLQAAIEGVNKAIEEANKKGEQHLSGMEKTIAGYDAQTRAAQAMEIAYGHGADAVARARAQQEAEAKAISDNLIPGTRKYTEAISDLTARILAKNQADAGAKMGERLAELKEATDAQLRINAAYDGTEASVTKAQNAEKAASDARRSGLTPGTVGYTERVRDLADAYDASSAAAEVFRQSQSSVAAVLASVENMADRIGTALVDGFINGRNAAVTMASVAKAAFASLATDAARLGVINPLVNGVLGTARPTLWSGLGTLAGGGAASAAGGGAGGLFGSLGNVMSVGRLSDALGLTDFGGQLSGIGRFLGISGDNGLFSGVGSLLNTPAWGTVNPGTALLDSMGITAGMPGTGAPTLGQLFGGVGLGFSAGSLLGGVLQRTFNRVGPAPTIGAGLGAGAGALIGSVIPGVGTLLGGLAGGLFGGGAGSLIGPRPATPFSATGLTADASGMLSVGRTFSQIVDTTAEVAALSDQVQRVNSILAASGTRIANAVSTDEFNQARIVGANSGQWLNFGQGGGRPGSLIDAFGELRFSSNDSAMNSALSGRAFGSLDDLAKLIDQVGKATSFLDNLVPALTDLTERSSQFSDALKAVNDTYGEAIAFARDTAQVQGISAEMADRLRQAETDLVAAREAASLKAVDAVLESVAAPLGAVPAQLKDIADTFDAALADIRRSVGASAAVTERLQQAELALVEARDRRTAQVYEEAGRSIYDYDASLNVRYYNVTADQRSARIFAADEQARLERQALDQTLVRQWGEAIRQTQAYADQFALLNRTLAAERASLVEQLDAVAAREARQIRDAATGSAYEAVSSIGAYARGLAFSAASPLSAQARFDLASRQFDAVSGAATAGDFRSIQGLPETADTLLATAREIYGSGANYVAVFERVRQAIEQLANRDAESLIVSAIRDAERSQTEALVSKLDQMRQELVAVKAELRQMAMAPRAA